jgi:3-(3-hydroxy-phenyl)propionate hydroxylase
VAGPAPGDPCPDDPVRSDGNGDWLQDHIGGGFTVLVFGKHPANRRIEHAGQTVPVVVIDGGVGAADADLVDTQGLVAERYDARVGTTYLIRPDQIVAARWRDYQVAEIEAAIDRCLAR